MSFDWLTRSVSGRVQVESGERSEKRSDLEHEVSHRSLARETWWAGTGLNPRHQDFQSCALPTELPAHHERLTIPERSEGVQNVARAERGAPSVERHPPRRSALARLVELGAGVGLEDDLIVVVDGEGLVEHEGHVALYEETGEAGHRHRVGVQVEGQGQVADL